MGSLLGNPARFLSVSWGDHLQGRGEGSDKGGHEGRYPFAVSPGKGVYRMNSVFIFPETVSKLLECSWDIGVK